MLLYCSLPLTISFMIFCCQGVLHVQCRGQAGRMADELERAKGSKRAEVALQAKLLIWAPTHSDQVEGELKQRRSLESSSSTSPTLGLVNGFSSFIVHRPLNCWGVSCFAPWQVYLNSAPQWYPSLKQVASWGWDSHGGYVAITSVLLCAVSLFIVQKLFSQHSVLLQDGSFLYEGIWSMCLWEEVNSGSSNAASLDLPLLKYPFK